MCHVPSACVCVCVCACKHGHLLDPLLEQREGVDNVLVVLPAQQVRVAERDSDHVGAGLIFGLVFLISGLAFKVSAAPFHMWTPDVYEGAPTPVVALFATAPKVAAMVLIVRVLDGAFLGIHGQWAQVLVLISLISFAVGSFGGLAQKDIQRLLAYSSIINIGYAILGIAAGFAVLAVAGGFGLAGLMKAVPQLHLALKFFGIVFLLYLAWKIGTATRATATGSSRPLSFLQAAAFQWINPKGVTLLASAIVAYSTGPDNIVTDLMVMVPIFVLATLSSACTWCLFGTMIGQFLKQDSALRRFNIAMATLLLVSMVPIFTG